MSGTLLIKRAFLGLRLTWGWTEIEVIKCFNKNSFLCFPFFSFLFFFQSAWCCMLCLCSRAQAAGVVPPPIQPISAMSGQPVPQQPVLQQLQQPVVQSKWLFASHAESSSPILETHIVFIQMLFVLPWIRKCFFKHGFLFLFFSNFQVLELFYLIVFPHFMIWTLSSLK